MDLMNTSRSVAWSCMRTRSPSSAPPLNGDDGSTASTPTRLPCALKAVTSALVEVDFPTPGEPVSPMIRAAPASGVSAAVTSRSRGDAFSTSEISRATARGEPSTARPTRSVTSTSRIDVEDEGVALTAAAAQGGRADAAAAAPQFVHDVQGEAGARHPDRVAEGDRAAVDVDLLGADAEIAHGLDGHRGERLVDLDQVEGADVHAGLAERVLERVRRLGLQRVVRAGHVAVRADLGEPRQAELFGLGLGHHHYRAGAVGDLGRRSGGDRAVLAERGPQPAQRFGRRVRPDALVGVEEHRVATALRHLDRDDLRGEPAVLDGVGGALVRAGGEFILF